MVYINESTFSKYTAEKKETHTIARWPLYGFLNLMENWPSGQNTAMAI